MLENMRQQAMNHKFLLYFVIVSISGLLRFSNVFAAFGTPGSETQAVLRLCLIENLLENTGLSANKFADRISYHVTELRKLSALPHGEHEEKLTEIHNHSLDWIEKQLGIQIDRKTGVARKRDGSRPDPILFKIPPQDYLEIVERIKGLSETTIPEVRRIHAEALAFIERQYQIKIDTVTGSIVGHRLPPQMLIPPHIPRHILFQIQENIGRLRIAGSNEKALADILRRNISTIETQYEIHVDLNSGQITSSR
jgi:hypothetical protein